MAEENIPTTYLTTTNEPFDVPKSNLKWYLIIGLLAFIVIFLVFFFFFMDKNSSTSIQDCKTDLNCFVNAAKKGVSANVTYSTTVDIFGVNQTSTSYLEIKNCSNGICTYYAKYINGSATFPAGTPQNVIENSARVYAFLKGMDGSCTFKREDLYNLLNRWKDGHFSSDDYTSGNCSGSMFETKVIDTGGNENSGILNNQELQQGQNQNPQGCIENWNCGSWSQCNNALQTRTCTDSNNCRTAANKPSVSESCQQNCDINKKKAIVDNMFASDVYWSDYANIAYKDISGQILIYCSNSKSNGQPYKLHVSIDESCDVWERGAELDSYRRTCNQTYPINGVCGTKEYNCNAGEYSNPKGNSTDSLWNCLGKDGGTNASCSSHKITRVLIVNKQGSGSGTVINSMNTGINCGSACSISYSDYDLVELTATADAGSYFVGWNEVASWGKSCSGNGTCYMVMGSDRNVTAVFNKITN